MVAPGGARVPASAWLAEPVAVSVPAVPVPIPVEVLFHAGPAVDFLVAKFAASEALHVLVRVDGTL